MRLLLEEKSLRSLGDSIDVMLGRSEEELTNLAADVATLVKRLQDAEVAQPVGVTKESLEQELEVAKATLATAKVCVNKTSILRNDIDDDKSNAANMLKKKKKKAAKSDEDAVVLAPKIAKLEKQVEDLGKDLLAAEEDLTKAKADKKKAKHEIKRLEGEIEAWSEPEPVDTSAIEEQLIAARQALVCAKNKYRSRAFAQTRIDLLLANLEMMEKEVFPDPATDDTDTETFIKDVWDAVKDTPDEAVYAHVITANARASSQPANRKRRSESPPPTEPEAQRLKPLDIGAPVRETQRRQTGGKSLPQGGAMSQVLLLSGFSKPEQV